MQLAQLAALFERPRNPEFRLVPLTGNPRTDAGVSVWETRDVAPAFLVEPTDGAFPTGWVLFRMHIARRGRDFHARLIFDVGNGFDAAGAVSLPATRKGNLLELVHFPRGLRALRFEPMQDDGVVELSDFAARPVGWLQRTWRMWRRVVPAYFMNSRERRAAVGLGLLTPVLDLSEAYKRVGYFRYYAPPIGYADWIARFDTLDETDRKLIRRQIGTLQKKQRFSLLLHVQHYDRALLASIDSVTSQLYPEWELWLVLCTQLDEAQNADLNHRIEQEPRIRLLRCTNTSQIDALNLAVARATGDYLGLLRAGNVLHLHALYRFAVAGEQHQDCAIFYSDDDRIDPSGSRFAPHFKSGWNPQYFLCGAYLGESVLIDAELVRKVAGFRPGTGNAMMFDLLLRALELPHTHRIRHIPSILFHQRADKGDREDRLPGTPPEFDAERRVLEESLVRRRIPARVSTVPEAHGYRIQYALPVRPPSICIVIPTRDRIDLLQRCIQSIFEKTTYPNFEVVVVDNDSVETETTAFLEAIQQNRRVKVLAYPHPFNFSAINNHAVHGLDCEIICLLNNDTEVISSDWLEEMVGLLLQKDVGVVGAKLLYDDDRVQHAGVLLVGGVANHCQTFLHREDPGYFGRARLAQDFCAVTAACMLVKRALYERLGGFDEENLPVAFNDVDFCLRARQAGHRIVWCPDALLYHHESVSRGADDTKDKVRRFAGEKAYMRAQWGHLLDRDPFSNPNLSCIRADFSLSRTPRNGRPWHSASLAATPSGFGDR